MLRVTSRTLVLLSVLGACVCYVAPFGDATCSYSFQVWRPEEDVLARLRSLEALCANVSATVDYQLLGLRAQLTREVLLAQNTSHRLEKELLETRLSAAQHGAQLRELRGDLTALGTTRPRDPQDSAHGAHRASVLVSQLQNNVGDLKAEWLLIKRDVNGIKSDHLQTKFKQTDLKTDTVKLKSLIEEMKTSAGTLRRELDRVSADQDSLQKAVKDQQTAGGTGTTTAEVGRLQEEVATVGGRCDAVEVELARLGGVTRDIRAQALAVLAGRGNVTVADMTRLLASLASDVPTGDTDDGSQAPATDCHDHYKAGRRLSGVYDIHPVTSDHAVSVYCAMDGGAGWTVISRRQDGTIAFDKGWLLYKYGFGALYGEHWLGNEHIHRITAQTRYRLRVDLWDWEGQRAYAEYSVFSVASSSDKYRLRVRGYRGNAGDSMSYHDGMSFSTQDSDNDSHMKNCAEQNKGGWWYHSCYSSNLNGVYHTGWYTKSQQIHADGIVWYTLKESEFYSLRRVEMKVRPDSLL